MKTARWFFLSMAVAFTSAGPFADAVADGRPARELAPSSGVVQVDGCTLTGRLVQDRDKVYAVLSATNPGAEPATVDVRFAVFLTAGGSPMMRMMPMPTQVAQGRATITVSPDSTVDHVLQVQEGVALPAPVEPPEEMAWDRVGPDTWRLLVSRSEIPEAAGWGAVAPSVSDETFELGKAQIVLAHTSTPEIAS